MASTPTGSVGSGRGVAGTTRMSPPLASSRPPHFPPPTTVLSYVTVTPVCFESKEALSSMTLRMSVYVPHPHASSGRLTVRAVA